MAQKSFRNIPDNIASDIKRCVDKPFVIYAVVKARIGTSLPNLPGLTLDNNHVDNFETLPEPLLGTWARRNIEGWEIVLRDEPKHTKDFSFESPNFGDWSLGSHEVTVEREVYPRDFFPGYASTVKVTELRRDAQYVTLGFELNRVFGSMPADYRDFLFALNVFQEAVGGNSAVRATDMSIENFVGSLKIDWEILPVGERGEVIRQIHARLNPNQKESILIDQRMNLLLSLRPSNFITGSSGFARYVGAQYGDGIIAFENIRYGNALYIMFEDWERLSRMSRLELLNSDEKFERIVHRPSWEDRAESIIREYR